MVSKQTTQSLFMIMFPFFCESQKFTTFAPKPSINRAKTKFRLIICHVCLLPTLDCTWSWYLLSAGTLPHDPPHIFLRFNCTFICFLSGATSHSAVRHQHTHAAKTKKSYRAHYSAYCRFCLVLHLPLFPAFSNTMSMYPDYLAQFLSLQSILLTSSKNSMAYPIPYNPLSDNWLL